jgi:hypothetical protein
MHVDACPVNPKHPAGVRRAGATLAEASTVWSVRATFPANALAEPSRRTAPRARGRHANAMQRRNFLPEKSQRLLSRPRPI